MHKIQYICLSILLIAGCDIEKKTNYKQLSHEENHKTDNHSYSNTEEISTNHLNLNLSVDFKKKCLKGVVQHRMLIHKKTKKAVFDVKGLKIEKVTIGELNEEIEAAYEIVEQKNKLLGNPLIIKKNPEDSIINIYYETTEESEALDWLDSNLTSSKKYPFLYTQGQAILTRSWIPIQDLPSNRFTYNATIHVPTDLMAVMSAKNSKNKNSTGIYTFEMSKKIPSYLMALAVGNLHYHPFSKNSGVYCEPELMKSCIYEFEDLPKMIESAEKLYGKYKWDQYDILVLPYSFPFGGMENPMLTFLNPTIIAGDKSLVSVVAHELAHSWSGNLVSNSSWDDFWLNEGFTVYFENRIMESIFGKDYADILALVEINELEEELRRISNSKHPEDSKLKLNLHGRDPDEGLTDIAYVKGAWFLKSMENHFGREKFDNFLMNYFNQFQFKSINTETFRKYFHQQLNSKSNIQFNDSIWIYQKGIPQDAFKIESKRIQELEVIAENISNNELSINDFKNTLKYRLPGQLKEWKTQDWILFLRHLKPMSQDKIKILNERLDLNKSQNAEIAFEWFVYCIKNNNIESIPFIEEYLMKIGRRKFVFPLFEEMVKQDAFKNRALEIFNKSKTNYHSVTKNSVEKLFTN